MELSRYIPEPWKDIFSEVLPNLEEISRTLQDQHINPEAKRIFAAFRIPPEKVKVVILGQDPYPDPGHATGLAFSVPKIVANKPPTLRNIFKEYVDDLGYPEPLTGDLSPWVEEGVLLLNPILTCKSGESLSHQGIGWEAITEHLLGAISSRKVVGILWGKKAVSYKKFFSEEMTLTSPHPSPLSAYRGFFGSKPFSASNQKLNGAGVSPINWRL